MAKKIMFLLVMMFVLIMASVTAFAGTETTTPEAGFTKGEADFLKDISTSDLEKNYGEIFFDEDSQSDKKIISVLYERAYSIEKSLRHSFTGSVIDTSDMNNVVVLMYIKIDGEYVPLEDIYTDENITEGLVVTNSTVDLEYLGSDKVNKVRIIAFRKNEASRLQLNQNLQVTDLDITVRAWNFIEKLKITYNEVKTNLTTP